MQEGPVDDAGGSGIRKKRRTRPLKMRLVQVCISGSLHFSLMLTLPYSPRHAPFSTGPTFQVARRTCPLLVVHVKHFCYDVRVVRLGLENWFGLWIPFTVWYIPTLEFRRLIGGKGNGTKDKKDLVA